MASFEDQLDVILKHEGKFQKWRQDRGNWFNGQLIGTKYGIIPYALAKHRGVRHITEAQMRALTLAEAKDIYRAQYYDRAKIRLLPDQIEFKVFDMCVNHGVHGGVKLLQRTLRHMGYTIDVDGKIGPQTVRIAYLAVREHGPRVVVNRMVRTRNAYYRAIIRNRPSQNRFRRGWLRRSNSFTNTADVAFDPASETTVPQLELPADTVTPDTDVADNDVDIDKNDLDGIERLAEWIIQWVENRFWRSKPA